MLLQNRAKERLRAGRAICSIGITVPAISLVSVLARSGADVMTVDLEHGAIDVESVYGLIAATGGSECVPVVRPPTSESCMIQMALDAGALGIVFPMVRTRQEVEAAVAATLFAPEGYRSVGHEYPATRLGLREEEYLENANDALLRVCLIETVEAVRNIEEILSVHHLDVATIAPRDLAAGMGHRGNLQHPDVEAAIRAVADAVAVSGVALGGVASGPSDVRKKIQEGYRFVALGFDLALFQFASKQMVSAMGSERS